MIELTDKKSQFIDSRSNKIFVLSDKSDYEYLYIDCVNNGTSSGGWVATVVVRLDKGWNSGHRVAEQLGRWNKDIINKIEQALQTKSHEIIKNLFI